MRAARLPVALRAFTELATEREGGAWRPPTHEAWPRYVLAFDTETTTDTTQRLVFGWYRFCEWKGADLRVLEEGIIYADELRERDPDAYVKLLAYVRRREAEAKDRLIKIRSRAEFVEGTFMEVVYRLGAMVVGFNLPFDLSRIAVNAGRTRGRGGRGFSLQLSRYWDKETSEWREHPYRPRVRVEHVNAKRARIQLKRPSQVEPDSPMARNKSFYGRFLDLRTLAFGLTGKGHSLTGACKAFRVSQAKHATEGHGQVTAAYIEYARQDVRATAELLMKLRKEFDRHPIGLAPDRVTSPAAIAKAYLTAMGVGQPLDTFKSCPRERLGHAMTGYYGGRAEVRIRLAEMPVVYCDFLSMYPTVNALMGLWRYLTARDIRCHDATNEVRRFLERVTAEDLAKPETWERLVGFALLDPNGDVVPVRAEYGADRSHNIGVNPLMPGGGPQWYALPDLVGSKLLTGRVPKILEAFRLVPVGRSSKLQPVELRGRIPVDPVARDFFRTVIEERKRLKKRELPPAEEKRLNLFLKVLANSGSYGIFAEMNPQDLRKGETREVRVCGVDSVFAEDTAHPETPGRFCFPPISAVITAAARLMLGLLEHHVAQAGGHYVLCDTDSMAIVATESGGLVPCPGGPERLPDGTPAVRALSWAEVDEIVGWFSQLNPYDPGVVPGSVLEIEDENFNEETGEREQLYTFAISAKRYALYNRRDGAVHLRKVSEHGLGHLMSPLPPDRPENWADVVWQRLIAEGTGEDPGEPPEWFDLPALTKTGISSPELLALFEAFNEGKPYAKQVKPFNFLLAATVAPFGHPAGADPEHFHLVAPYERDPERWAALPWFDVYSRRRVAVCAGVDRGVNAPFAAQVRTYGDVYRAYATHPEPKSAGADGGACTRSTVGLLARRPVEPVWREYVGKESNRLEDVHNGQVHDWDDVRHVYGNVNTPLPPHVRALMHDYTAAELAQQLDISVRWVRDLWNGHRQPSPKLLRDILWVLR